ncbi:MAG: prephenate dehydrogenase [Tepidiformaceae bacterium]
MSRPKIAIVGTGLIGSSVGLALMAKADRAYEVVGTDVDRGTARAAKKRGALDKDLGSVQEAIEGAGLVILCVPVAASKQLLRDMSPYLKQGAVVTDTCSTKADIMRWAQEFLPDGVHFVGGHPMAGSEKSGPDAARADLFKEASWAVTPTPRADEGAVGVVLGFVETMGAFPLYIDPAEHDQYAAAVSHMPILLSVGLFRMVRDSQAWEDMSLLAGPGFRDLTRLASGDPVMARDILATNREAVLHWLGRFQSELDNVYRAIETGGDVVFDLLGTTQMDRDRYIANPPTRRLPEGSDAPSSKDAMGRLFFGGLYDKMKEMTDKAEANAEAIRHRPTASLDDDKR